MKPLRIALTKGRLEKDSIRLFEKIGYDCTAVHNKGRKLILPIRLSSGESIEVVLADKREVIRIMQEERVSLRAGLLLMAFVKMSGEDPFAFLEIKK